MGCPLGERIREIRCQRGMSQKELAQRVGLSKTAMNALECGHTVDPRFSVMVRISLVLDEPMESFVVSLPPRACPIGTTNVKGSRYWDGL